jgi:uncharacterized protein RhaS with RHS repeats
MTGQVNFKERWFDPPSGRWTSQDPLRFSTGDSNLYRYVGNNSVNLVDPSGLAPPIKVAGGTLTARVTMGQGGSLINPTALSEETYLSVE